MLHKTIPGLQIDLESSAVWETANWIEQMKTILLTGIAMLAFAANSILCRMALETEALDVATFTFVRTLSGAFALIAIIYFYRGDISLQFSWPASMMLFSYMASFSFAYLKLPAGTGALILFGAVQITMLSWTYLQGERFTWQAKFGVLLALGGLTYLLMPGTAAPDLQGGVLMLVAGVSWGTYSLMGRNVQDPIGATAGNFVIASPLAMMLWLPNFVSSNTTWSLSGVVLALISGVIASALGYTIWFAAVKSLKASQASIIQLSVPVIAGMGGFVLLLEVPSAQFLIASVLTLGGVWLVLWQRNARTQTL